MMPSLLLAPHFCASCGKFGASIPGNSRHSNNVFFCSKPCFKLHQKVRRQGSNLRLSIISEVSDVDPANCIELQPVSCALCSLGRGTSATRRRAKDDRSGSVAESSTAVVSTCSCGTLVGFWV
ncbi:hypothetical protein AC1031_010039 [Aphanomyces cochlioides]|nr:hypothetical protein AC1031_010039 [Aphanomyces cochlioides]